MSEIQYCSLHQHSDASFLDSCNKPEDLAKRAKEVGMTAIALTDHGNCHNFVKMHNACKEQGVKFIPGLEFYFTHKNAEKERKSRHLTIIAKNNIGLSNIYKLITWANKSVMEEGGFYYRPRIDWELLEKYYDGLICLTGCMNSPVNHEFGRNDDYDEGVKHLKHLLDIFGKEHLFVELQLVNDPLNRKDRKIYIPEQDKIFEYSRKAAKELKLECCATNDSHYLKESDSFTHEILKAIDARATLKTPVVDHEKGITRGRLVFNGFDYHVKSTDEMLKKFKPEEVAISTKIANMCDVKFETKEHMPLFEKDLSPEQAYEMLVEECRKGWKLREINLKSNKQDYENRIKTELADIRDAGLANYFLIVWDVLRYCREHLIPVGPGRGSAAGSFVSHLLYITQVDPIKHGLIWERFWNRGRKGSMPDIDVDVSIKHKDKIVEYIKEKFGKDRVFPMMTIAKMTAKEVIKDVGKVLGLSFGYVGDLNDHIKSKHGVIPKIKDAIEQSKVLKRAATEGKDWETDLWEKELKTLKSKHGGEAQKLKGKIAERQKTLKSLFIHAQRLENICRHRGTHPCAILIYDKSVFGEIPLCWDTKKKQYITGLDMYDLEELGCLKLDILGLKTLDVIADAHPEGAKCLYEPDKYFKGFNDPDVYDLFAEGKTKGVFQLESPLGKQWCRKLKPENQGELSDLVSLIRPAVLEIGMADDYVKYRRNPMEIAYIHPDLEPILKDTYGCQLYQEQMIKLSEEFAGYDKAESDALRKAVGKKIPEKIQALKKSFVEGVTKVKNDAELADTLWTWIEQGASYGFNKSHAMCYGGYLGYITAYIKTHYPQQFFLSLLNYSQSGQNPLEEIRELFFDAKLFDINIRPPSIDNNNIEFEIKNNDIYFGLNYIKDIGKSSLKSLAKIKGYSWEDILYQKKKIKIKKDVLAALIKSGSLDHLGVCRRIMYLESEFVRELTDKELPIFRHILYGDPNFLRKETKKLTVEFCILRGKDFRDSVSKLKQFLTYENVKLKFISSNRAMTAIKLCEKFIEDYHNGEDYTIIERSEHEAYYLGIPVTCSKASAFYDEQQTHFLLEVEKEYDGIECTVIGVINRVSYKKDKKKRDIAFVGIEDDSFAIDVGVFSKQFEKYNKLLKVGSVVLVDGKKSKDLLIAGRIRLLG